MWNREPAVIINGLSGLLTQVLPLLVVVGIIELSPDRLAGYVSIIGLVLSFVSTTLIRNQVTSESTVNRLVNKAVDSPSGTTVAEVKEKIEKEENE